MMMSTLFTFLKETPWWIYLLSFCLLLIGLSALQPKVVSILKLAILPIFFTALSIHTLMISFTINTMTIATWAGSILFGILLGLVLASGHDYKVDRKNLLILLPGNWMPLILILIIFGSKYYFGYELSIDPSIAQNTNFQLIMLAISGSCTGVFIGVFISYLYYFFTAKSVDLKAID
ncbi:MAG: hypothetical protein Q8L78_09300 [Coxiellaceae bacterium]|nr:hypothetical protein [Coxiellaceae bacterium]